MFQNKNLWDMKHLCWFLEPIFFLYIYLMHVYHVPGIMLEIGNTHFNRCEYSLCFKSLSLIKVN